MKVVNNLQQHTADALIYIYSYFQADYITTEGQWQALEQWHKKYSEM